MYVLGGEDVVKGLFSLLLYLVALSVVPVSGFAASTDASNYLDEHPTQKWAFVLGNSNYVQQDHIESASTDATNVANALHDLGFVIVSPSSSVSFTFWTFRMTKGLNRLLDLPSGKGTE